MEAHQPPRQSPATLAFRDAELERAFRLDMAHRSLAHFRVVIPAALVLWIAVIPFDSQLGGISANADLMTKLRLTPVPLLASLIALGFMKPAQFARWSQLAMSVTFGGLLLSIALMIAWVPYPEIHDSAQTAAGFALVIVTGYAAAPLRLVYAIIPAMSVTIFLIITLAIRTDHVWVTTLWFVIGHAVGIIGCYMLEQYRRRVFLFAQMLEAERAKSDQLLYNLLPTPIADRLKQSPGGIADFHEEATVLFADLVGFTPLATRVPPEQLVTVLDELFSQFDELADEVGVEKIKTIGDAYMVVGGVPTENPDHVEAIAKLAIAMRKTVAEFRGLDGTQLQLRIGIHTGAVVAGVIGRKKAVYDLWGDTVNIASRMESHGVEGEIQVSSEVAERLKDHFRFSDARTVTIKGKGDMTTHLLLDE